MQSFQPINSDIDYLDFSQCWKALKRRWIPAVCVAGAVIGICSFNTSQQKPIYEAEGKLLFKDNKTSSLAGLNKAASELSSLTGKGNPLDTQAEIIRSASLVEQAIGTLNAETLKSQPNLTINEVLSGLKVHSIAGTDILSVSYRHEDPELAAQVINQLMSLYLDTNILTNRAEAKAAREFISQQLPAVEDKVVQAEEKLRQFQEKNGIVSLSEEKQSALGVVSQIEGQLADAQGSLADLNRRKTMLQKELGMTPSQALAINNLNQSQAVQAALTEYRQVQNELELERLRYQDTSPAIEHLIRKEDKLKLLVQARIFQVMGSNQAIPESYLQMGATKQALAQELIQVESERLGLAERVSALSEVYQDYRGRLQVVPRLEQNQRQLARELKAAQSTYEQLLAKLQEVQVVENQNVGNAKVMAQAVAPSQSVAPNRTSNMARGVALGLLLGTGTALLLDSRDKSLKTVEDVEQLLGYPLLGRIPALPESKAKEAAKHPTLPVRDNPYSPASAAYEMLQATLDFAMPDQTLQHFVVTSAIPGEGKSTVSSNLAVAMAQMGRRVLIVDADLRRPRQHQIWQVPNLVGLSDVLVGRADFNSAIREVMVNVDLLCCGTIPPNPSALLGSSKMASLIKLWASHYDCIIIDTPPVTLFPDALKLGKQVDGILPVARPGLIETQAAANMKKLMNHSGANILGIVVNATNSGNDSESYLYHHSYYYQDRKHLEAQSELESIDKSAFLQAEASPHQP